MRWAATRLPVPPVIGCGTSDGTDWLLTRALAGVDATDPEWISRPEELTQILARGLRRFHSVSVADCPFGFTLDVALEHVRGRAGRKEIDPNRDFHPEHRHLDVAEALAELERLRPKSEDLVLCHGDYCPPNVLIEGNAASAFVDLGEMGIADRWWDLAIATWSLDWNLGAGWGSLFLDTYRIEPDDRKLEFFRLLYDLAS
jgi:kanamycin kinase